MSKPRFLLVGAEENKSTDGMINLGVHAILKSKYGEYDYDYINNDLEVLPTLFDEESYDLIVQCGGPWLWSHFWNTPKKKNFEAIMNAHCEAKVVFMGIGTCMDLDKIGTGFLMDPKTRKHIQSFFGQAHTIIVRESDAKEIFDNAGIDCVQLPCPAFYVEIPQENQNKDGPAMIWYDPRKGVSRDYWLRNPKEFERYVSEFRDYNASRGPMVYCAHSDDIPGAIEVGLPRPQLLKTADDTVDMIRRATLVFSGRVHCAIPAEANDILTSLVAVDSRASALYDYWNDRGNRPALTEYIKHLPELK